MLIKKNLKIKQRTSCLVSKLKKQPFPAYPTYNRLRKDQALQINSRLNFLTPSSQKIERLLLESLPCQLKSKIQTKQEQNILSFLYPMHCFNFQGKSNISEPFSTYTLLNTLTNYKKENNICIPFMQFLEKQSKLKIVLKSYSTQPKDIEISITMISKLIYYLDRCCVKQLKTFLTNSFYSASFRFYPRFFNHPIKNSNDSNNIYPKVFSTFNLLDNFKMRLTKTSFKKKINTRIISSLNLNLLIEQPLIELFGAPNKIAKEQKEKKSTFLLSMLQKTNYCNRYFFKSSTFLDSVPINKRVQKMSKSTQLFTVTRSPFVFKKTREQFIKQQLSYNIILKFHTKIQKQLFIQCLSLLRLPVEFEIHC